MIRFDRAALRDCHQPRYTGSSCSYTFFASSFLPMADSVRAMPDMLLRTPSRRSSGAVCIVIGSSGLSESPYSSFVKMALALLKPPSLGTKLLSKNSTRADSFRVTANFSDFSLPGFDEAAQGLLY